MLTKRQFAYALIEAFTFEHFNDTGERISATDYDVLEPFIPTSSTLSVALEYLGKLKDPVMIQYAKERGGVLFDYFPIDIEEYKKGNDMLGTLTAREIMNMLLDD